MTRLLGLNPSPPKASDLRLATYLDKPALLDRGQAPRLLDWAAAPYSADFWFCSAAPRYSDEVTS